ncbi:MAG: 16S rRNA (adenine(1518)-N(6)/adenine(1519)-N(6))-dimethyltransferase RsmA [Luteibaculaceae bacterium]
MNVKPKKHLGQHFLKEASICKKIVEALNPSTANAILEIGPGMGALTEFLLEQYNELVYVSEIDTESIDYLKTHLPSLNNRILSQDFLTLKLGHLFPEGVTIIGNFPYNISTQILIKVVENKDLVPEMVGMFQKEVAERVISPPGSKVYGITSVFAQLWYNSTYLFTVKEGSFIPPPKVKSGVIKLVRNNRTTLPVEEKFLYQVIKTGFNQRRKTLRNSLKSLMAEPNAFSETPIFNQRPEQLSPDDFIELALLLQKTEN